MVGKISNREYDSRVVNDPCADLDIAPSDSMRAIYFVRVVGCGWWFVR